MKVKYMYYFSWEDKRVSGDYGLCGFKIDGDKILDESNKEISKFKAVS